MSFKPWSLLLVSCDTAGDYHVLADLICKIKVGATGFDASLSTP